ncbi:uncharacterized protein LOC103098741 [Monodelphis domestica]|uniref:uncharacterized protein LOC103098741 n=1 Tax=Monodelphis domestica TaxID=13616 RepID=UPI00044323C9|nr:uncharacterized protein LOC103098741 [Monodelphis domestica]
MAWVLELILLLTPCGYLAIASVNNLTVNQSPPKLCGVEGGFVEITCSWIVSPNVTQLRVEWIKVNGTYQIPTVINSTVYKTETNLTPEIRKENLKLEKLNTNYSGHYFCEITIEKPTWVQGKGNGTFLTVKGKNKESEKSKESKEQWPWWALAIFLLLTASVYLSYTCKKRKNSRRIDPERTVQEEGEESEYIEMEKTHKEDERAQSDTTEWAVSVLYEPMNSFAVKPSEQNGNDIYTYICSDTLP